MTEENKRGTRKMNDLVSLGDKETLQMSDKNAAGQDVPDWSAGDSIQEVELAKQIEKSPEYYVCPYTGNRKENDENRDQEGRII